VIAVAPSSRVAWLDSVKALAMILVYTGHVLEKMYANFFLDAALLPWQLIYSFHLPLFFLLAGLFAKPQRLSLSKTIGEKIRTRLIPILFFSLLILPFWWWQGLSESRWLDNARGYAYGFTAFNLPTWFLMCLFMVEIEAAFVFKWMTMFSSTSLFKKFATSKNVQTLLLAACFFLLAYLLAAPFAKLTARLGVPLQSGFIYESLIALGFYLAGYSVRNIVQALPRSRWLIVLAVVATLLWFAAATHNSPPFFRVVLMVAAAHGNYGLFLLAALSGCIMTIGIMRLLDIHWSCCTFVARNSLIYLGLNGFFFHFIDARIFAALGPLPNNSWLALLIAMLYASIAMLSIAPLVIFLRRFFSRWLGFKSGAAELTSH
jgi:acyltransferase